MEEPPNKRQRPRITEAQWKTLWLEYRESGESQTKFCKRRGINYFNFQFWRKTFGDPELPKQTQDMPAHPYVENVNLDVELPPEFSPVTITSLPCAAIEVCFPSGIKIAVRPGANKATLQILFELLE